MKNPIAFFPKIKSNVIKTYRESLETENLPHTYFRLILLISVFFVVLAHWYVGDIKSKYRVGHPAPMDYYAITVTNYYDTEATQELRKEAEQRIAKVMVRTDESVKALNRNIARLKAGRLEEVLSRELCKIIRNKNREDQAKLISVAAELLRNLSLSDGRESEQSKAIWGALDNHGELTQPEKNIVFQICNGLMVEAYEADPELLANLRESVSSQIPVRKRHLEPGDLIVAEGKVVTQDLKKALMINRYQEAKFPWISMLIAFFVVFLWSYVPFWVEKRRNTALPINKWLFIACMIALHWMLELAFDHVTSYRCFSLVGLSCFFFLTLQHDMAYNLILGSGFLSMFLFFSPDNCLITIVCATLGYIIFSSTTSMERRSVIWFKVVTYSLLVSLAVILMALSINASALTLKYVITSILFAFFWGLWVVAGLPIIENVFKILTPLKLLELSSMTNPTLRQLQIEAPGTYNHTLSVANLAETVAEKLGLDSLLVRVGAMFHDIGKLKCPGYFVENQPFNNNVHDDMSPVISAKILIDHAKNGYEMAKEMKLPPEICDMIIQHHGTTFLSYFYDKAVALNLDVDKKDFTYPGPKPKTKEAALLMIVDSVEAALKGNSKPLTSKEELFDFINRIIKTKLDATQLERVEFTLKDLNTICQVLADNCANFNYSRHVKTIDELVAENLLQKETIEKSKARIIEASEVESDEI